jgi:uncharacterized membrane protein
VIFINLMWLVLGLLLGAPLWGIIHAFNGDERLNQAIEDIRRARHGLAMAKFAYKAARFKHRLNLDAAKEMERAKKHLGRVNHHIEKAEYKP